MTTTTLTSDRPRTIIGPLTTTFTPPGSCSALARQCTWCTNAWQGQTCSGDSNVDYTACWPQASSGAPSPTTPFYGWGFYSPGWYCPSGYVTACSATGPAQQSGWDFEIQHGETVMGCCPSGWACNYNWGGQTCLSIATTSQSFPVSTCANSGYNAVTWLTLPTVTTVETAATVSSTATVVTFVQTYTTFNFYGPLIELRWQSSDAPPSATSTTSQSQTAAVSTSAAATSASSNSGGLSTGAEAGIGVGVALGVLAVIGALAYLLLARRRARKDRARAPRSAGDHAAMPFHEQKLDMGAQGQAPVHEMDALLPQKPNELPADARAELPGSEVPEMGHY